MRKVTVVLVAALFAAVFVAAAVLILAWPDPAPRRLCDDISVLDRPGCSAPAHKE